MEYQRIVNKNEIPTCELLGVHIAAVNMNWVLEYLRKNIQDIKGDYICVSNVLRGYVSGMNELYHIIRISMRQKIIEKAC